MNKFFTLLLLGCFYVLLSHAQVIQPYGVVDMADLQLKDCDFEKGANAMVLFDEGKAVADVDFIEVNYRMRIKIFNAAGVDEGNIRIPYYSYGDQERVTDIEAQTINLENGKIVITKLDPKSIYTQVLDRYNKVKIFVLPNVKPGSVIEYKYKWNTDNWADFPNWYFQSNIPSRYSELQANITNSAKYKITLNGHQKLVKDTSIAMDLLGNAGHSFWWAKSNIPSYKVEAYVTKGINSKQRIEFQLGLHAKNWDQITYNLSNNRYFALEMEYKLSGEDTLVNVAKQLKTDDEKIEYLFNKVKTDMTWNKENDIIVDKGVKTAWKTKTGNAAEINIILYRLLDKAGVKVYPMIISTPDHGAIRLENAGFNTANKMVVYSPVADSTKCYVLDASDKYNVYNMLPAEVLNTYGVIVDVKLRDNKTKLIYLTNDVVAKRVVIIDGEIEPDSKVTGTTNIVDYGYNKLQFKKLFDHFGETQYLNILNKTEKYAITNYSVENMQIDSLPSIQKFKFNLNPNTAEDNYIYFDPKLVMSIEDNPFTNETRNANIDFGYCTAYSFNGAYKLPAGFKIDVVPQSTILYMPDKSIVFKRIIGELNGALQVHYNITYIRSTYGVTEYKSLHDFYKKMYELLNEPVVLKKG